MSSASIVVRTCRPQVFYNVNGKIGTVTLDAIVRKYRGECRVAVDRIVVVSRRGFSKGATEKATALGVELLTLDDAKVKDWLSESPGNVRFESKPHVRQVVFDPSPEGVEPTSLVSEGRIFCPHGHDHGSIREYANHVMFCHAMLAEPGKGKLRELEEGIRSSPEGEGTLTADFERRGWKVLYKGTEHAIEKMRVVLHAIAAKGEGSCKTYVRSSTDGSTRVFRHIEMTAASQRVSIVMPADRGVPDKITLRLDNVHPHEKRNTKSITSQQTKKTESDQRSG